MFIQKIEWTTDQNGLRENFLDSLIKIFIQYKNRDLESKTLMRAIFICLSEENVRIRHWADYAAITFDGEWVC